MPAQLLLWTRVPYSSVPRNEGVRGSNPRVGSVEAAGNSGAVEELVTNAYDALATDVRLLVPANTAAEEATIWVIDNGESMDTAGLHELWQIASSRKRIDEDARPRRPIGRFGIGKPYAASVCGATDRRCERIGASFRKPQTAA